MSEIYVLKVTYEKNADDGIRYFTDERNLAENILDAEASDATSIRVFRCVEVEFNAYRVSAAIDIGKDK